MRKNYISKIFFIFMITISISIKVFADDYIEDDFVSDNLEDIEVSNTIQSAPTINARHAAVYDRASGRLLYGKSEKETCKWLQKPK